MMGDDVEIVLRSYVAENLINVQVTTYNLGGIILIDSNIGHGATIQGETVNGIDRLVGEIIDERTGKQIVGALITIKDLTAQTDSFGQFNLVIPENQQELEQEVSVYKNGYAVYRKTIPMLGSDKFRLLLHPN